MRALPIPSGDMDNVGPFMSLGPTATSVHPMPRPFFDRVLPKPSKLRDRWYLRPFDALVHDPALRATHRKGVSKAFAIGLFLGWMPIPGQMVVAALWAIWARCNVAVAVVSVFVTNPVTMGPMFYYAYRLGAWLLGRTPGQFHIELSFDWLLTGLARTWEPLLLGCGIMGVITAVLGYLGLNLLWSRQTYKRWRSRRRD